MAFSQAAILPTWGHFKRKLKVVRDNGEEEKGLGQMEAQNAAYLTGEMENKTASSKAPDFQLDGWS